MLLERRTKWLAELQTADKLRQPPANAGRFRQRESFEQTSVVGTRVANVALA
jgi:hypothetical protein